MPDNPVPTDLTTTPDPVKPTPGPWSVSDERECEEDHFATVISFAPDSRGVEVARLYGQPPYSDGEGLANARLIAASPDLLAACHRADALLGELRRHVSGLHAVHANNVLETVRAAIAKAEGA